VRALLVERGDFASGTSSWSSKLVHGGLRYLKSGQWRMTLESVRERERLLRERPGLVEPQPFVMPIAAGGRPGPLALAAAFWIADRMAGHRTARRIAPEEARALEPALGAERLRAAIAYRDGVVDDARLVLRLIFDAVGLGARALNHVEATLVESGGRVRGARLIDRLDGTHAEVDAKVTVHAGGVWAGAAPGAPTLRPLRGSHLVFARETVPVQGGLAWLHPRDRRPVFAHVWEGAVLVGTTDVDHPVAEVPATISPAEADYLVEALRLPFPALRIEAAHALSTFAGLRAIVVPPGEAHLPPSAMGRDSALWTRPGLVGITGGKLTTHRATAAEVLREVERQGVPMAPDPGPTPAPPATRLAGRLGAAGAAWVAARPADERAPLAGTPYSEAELRWSLREEQVRSLEDLLMRRSRVGLVGARGGEALLPRLEAPCREALGWDAARWRDEVARHLANWAARHAPPAQNRRP
jgi:glycerol-3-phosphate dehydrogenase